ncbi:hypothetical protein M1397_03595 [Candidatus Marsarchaeota archaeon]|nr:hypothetical protein [Candidatus Marsarchaeota archaeon]
METKGQNAIEFLSNYSIVILILTVAIAFVLILANAPSALFPSQCSSYGGFSCADAVYSFNGPGSGSQLFVELTDTQPGLLNISSFSAQVSHIQSSTGYCTPPVAMQGEKVYCTANVPFTPTLGDVYSGRFNISANYCSVGIGQQSVACPSNGNFVYSGGIEVQAGRQQISMGPYYYLPLNITNPTNSPTQTGFQMQINLTANSILYTPHERSDLGNLRFYDAAQALYSWCESGCNSSAGKAVFWVKMDRPILANSVITLQMYFLPNNIEYSGRYAGEAPQLSCPDPSNTVGCSTYAEYDNGARVFNNYWNFAGTALPSGLTTTGTGSYSVSNGITITSGGNGYYVYGTQITYPQIVETLIPAAPSTSTEYIDVGESTGTALAIDGVPYSGYSIEMPGASGGLELRYEGSGGGGSVTNNAAFTFTNDAIYSMAWVANGNEQIYVNYQNEISSTNTVETIANYYPYIGVFASSNSAFFQWLRTRAYPPNGVMPSVSFSNHLTEV